MPLSFSAQLGGCLTVMGSSATLMAQDAVKAYYEMHFLSPFIPAAVVSVVTSVACAFLSPTLLRSASQDDQKPGLPLEKPPRTCYDVLFKVQPHGRFDGLKALTAISMLNQ